MNTNDLVYKIAARAKELADKRIIELRFACPSSDAETPGGVLRQTRHRTRGDLIEEILVEEFVEEFPKEIAEE